MTTKLLLVVAALVGVVAFTIEYLSRSEQKGLQNVKVPFLESQMEVKVDQVFQDSYRDARESFRRHSSAIPGAETYRLPVLEKKDYTIDVTVLPGTNHGLVVHTSGVHGIEGYAGSAIQIAFLKGLLLQNVTQQRLPTIILVHAFNPVGMDLYRRTNENNVDLNRNALSQEQWKTFAPNHPNRATYERFDKTLFNLNQDPTFFTVHFLFWAKAIQHVFRYGSSTLKAAMVGGQHYNPKGIFYGGSQTEKSYLVLRRFLEGYLEQHPNLLQNGAGADADAVTWIDVHTGLGKFGQDTLLRGITKEGPVTAPVDAFATWFPPRPEQNTGCPGPDHESKSVSAGYEQVRGLLGDYFADLFQDKAMFVTQEFGTIPSFLVGHALIVENAAFHRLSAEQAKEWAEKTTKRAFYPCATSWKHCVVDRGLHVLEQSIGRSMFLSSQAHGDVSAEN